MKILKSTLTSALVILFFSQIAQADEAPVTEPSLGEKLVRQLWVDMKENNIAAIEKMIAPGFQSIHEDGSRAREEEIELIKGLNLGEYTLTDFNVTQTGSVIIVTYFVSVQETINNKRLSMKPAARLSIFMETDSGWQWIAHANLKALN